MSGTVLHQVNDDRVAAAVVEAEVEGAGVGAGDLAGAEGLGLMGIPEVFVRAENATGSRAEGGALDLGALEEEGELAGGDLELDAYSVVHPVAAQHAEHASGSRKLEAEFLAQMRQ